MADKVITVTAPVAASPGVAITLQRSATGMSLRASYVAGGVASEALITEAEYAALPLAFRTDVEALFTRVVPNATVQTRMGF